MTYRAKLLVPYYDGKQFHLRGAGDTNNDNAIDLIKEFYERDGYCRYPTLCGTYVASYQSVLSKIDKGELCGNCKRVADARDIRIKRIYSGEKRITAPHPKPSHKR